MTIIATPNGRRGLSKTLAYAKLKPRAREVAPRSVLYCDGLTRFIHRSRATTAPIGGPPPGWLLLPGHAGDQSLEGGKALELSFFLDCPPFRPHRPNQGNRFLCLSIVADSHSKR